MYKPSGHVQVVEKTQGQNVRRPVARRRGPAQASARAGLGQTARNHRSRRYRVAGGGRAEARRPPRTQRTPRTGCASSSPRAAREAHCRSSATRSVRPARSTCATSSSTASAGSRRSATTATPCARTSSPTSVRTAPVRSITTEDIDAFREDLLFEREPLATHGAEDARAPARHPQARQAQEVDRREPGRGRRADHPEAVGRLQRPLPRPRSKPSPAPPRDEQDDAIFLTAAFSGLRLGELRGAALGRRRLRRRAHHRPQGRHPLAGGPPEVRPGPRRPDERPGRSAPSTASAAASASSSPLTSSSATRSAASSTTASCAPASTPR